MFIREGHNIQVTNYRVVFLDKFKFAIDSFMCKTLQESIDKLESSNYGGIIECDFKNLVTDENSEGTYNKVIIYTKEI